MKKLTKFTIYCCLLLTFCTFLLSPKSHHRPQRRVFADVVPSELELKEYQELEHGIATSIEFEADLDKISQTDTTPSKNYTIVIDAGHGGPDPGSI